MKIRRRKPQTKPKTASVRKKRVSSSTRTINRYKTKKLLGTSYIEILFAKYLKEAKVPYKAQYKIARLGRNKGRNYYADFAIPSKNLIIECDGKYYHSGKYAIRDKKRQKELEKMGWAVIRFTGSEIVRNTRACVQSVLEYIQE